MCNRRAEVDLGIAKAAVVSGTPNTERAEIAAKSALMNQKPTERNSTEDTMLHVSNER